MLEPIRGFLSRLSALDPNLPWALLAVGIFELVYLTRKVAPRAWQRFESLSPVKIGDGSAVHAALHKAFQALPSVLLGAALPALLSGGDVQLALAGAAVGLLPPVLHELAKWAPFLPYKGATSKTSGKPPALPLPALFALALLGCSGAQPPPCDQATLAGIVAECTVRAEQECLAANVAEEDCPVLKECDDRLDKRAEVCR